MLSSRIFRFLNLYLQLLGGAQLDYDLLVLDSTPILPSPQSYTRFARAYMATMPAPANWIPKVIERSSSIPQ